MIYKNEKGEFFKDTKSPATKEEFIEYKECLIDIYKRELARKEERYKKSVKCIQEKIDRHKRDILETLK